MMSWADMAANDGPDTPFDPFLAQGASKMTSTSADTATGAAPTAHHPSKKERTVFAMKSKNPDAAPSNGTGVNGTTADNGDKENRNGVDRSTKALIASKNARIQELEGEVKAKDHHIAELVAQLDERDRRIEQLEQDLTVYRHCTVDLERKLAALQHEKAVPEHTEEATQHAPQTDSPPESPSKVFSTGSIDDIAIIQVSVAESDKSTDGSTVVVNAGSAEKFTDGPQDSIPDGSKEESTAPDAELPSPEITTDGSADHVIDAEAQLKPKAADTEPITVEEASIASPSVSTTEASPETPKETKAKTTAAQVKPAPKLSFPIKNGGKLEPKATTAAWADKAATHIGQGALTAGLPNKDLREMPLPERNDLFRGPTISIIVGTEHIRGFPKNMFMAVSPRVRKYFEVNPNETYIAFPARTMAVPCLEILKVYFRNMGSHKNVYSLKLHHVIEQDLAIRRDCIFLGMDKYVAHFTRLYCDKIRAGFLGLENIACVERNTVDNDSLWECLCNNLASMRLRGQIPESEKFEEFLKSHPRLAQAIGRIEARLQMSRPSQSATRSTPGSRSQSKARSTSSGSTALNIRQADKPQTTEAVPKNASTGHRPQQKDVKAKTHEKKAKPAESSTAPTQKSKPAGSFAPQDRKTKGTGASSSSEHKAKGPSEMKAKPVDPSTSPEAKSKPATTSTSSMRKSKSSTPPMPSERKLKPGDRIAEYERMCAEKKNGSAKSASIGSTTPTSGNGHGKAG